MMFTKVGKLICLRIALIILILASSYSVSYAQLKKTAEIETVKYFSQGSVALRRVLTEDVYYYCVVLKNNSQYFDPVVLWLGNKADMLKNLRDLSIALENGKKGECFEFSAVGEDYNLYYRRVLGQKCFEVHERISVSNDFGRLFKVTIDAILKYMQAY